MLRTLALSLLATSTLALAVPAPQQLTFDSAQQAASHLFHTVAGSARARLTAAEIEANKIWDQGVRTFDDIVTDGITYEHVKHDDFPQYSIRINKESPKLCDTTVASISGYLDIDADTHLFFWFFESRSNPAKDPLVLWLNGGPGCSSSTGLLFELGPCSIANEGQNTTFNKNSWTESANMIFLDSPVQVGYSYGGKTINNSQDTAKDIYAFFQLFYQKFTKFADHDLHISGESYAGTYIPNIGSFLHQSNLAPPTPESLPIPLKSLFIGNGLTDTFTQFASVPTYSCDNTTKYGVLFDEQTCASMRSKVATCQRLTQLCYNSPNRFTCVPATLSCWQIASPIQNSGLNPYDVRKKCDRDGDDGPLCYKEMGWVETYLNKPEVKSALGVPQERGFASCNMQVNQAFMFNGDVAHNTAALIPPLLQAGIKVMIYAGEADFMCNYLGNEAWTLALEWSGKEEFNSKKLQTYHTGKKAGGLTRSVGKGSGLFTYLQVFDAGHMVPRDQPEVSLDFFTKWIQDVPLV